MSILGIDLGTTTGFARLTADGLAEVYSNRLASTAEVSRWSKEGLLRARDPRIERLYDHVRQNYLDSVHHVVFEDVVFASTTYQAQLWASLRAAVWLGLPRATWYPVPVGTLKKFATGNGSADKELMRKAAKLAGLAVAGLDDNAIDAFWLARWGTRHII